MNELDFTIREATAKDLPFLWEMLFEAAAVSEEIRRMGPAQALALPAIAHILENFGREGDFGFVAGIDEPEILIGAIWARLFDETAPGYGFISKDIPELAIAVVPEFRGRGVGTKLLAELIRAARDLKLSALSLSVDRGNPARPLYERFGFSDAGTSPETDSSLTMILRLR